jgi:hypothetical protein
MLWEPKCKKMCKKKETKVKGPFKNKKKKKFKNSQLISNLI